jgi:hypothetical protein
LSGLSKEILGHVNTKTMATGAWAAIEGLYAAQSRARVIATRMALATASRGTSTITEYFSKMKALAEEMAVAGKKLDDDELVSYILTGLDEPFDPVVSAASQRVEPITVSELFTQLVSHEPMNSGSTCVEGAATPPPTLRPGAVAVVGTSTRRVAAVVATVVAPLAAAAAPIAAAVVVMGPAMSANKHMGPTSSTASSTKFATKKSTAQHVASRGLMQISLDPLPIHLKNQFPPPPPTASTQIGTSTLAPLITSPGTWRSSPFGTGTWAVIKSMRPMEQVWK